MRTIIFSLLFFLFLNCGAATAQRIGVRGNKTGGVVVTRGKARATIKLSEDVAGCGYLVAGEYKRDLDARECSAPPAGFKLIDATVKDNQVYLVVLTEAMGNCNVCGQCGASEAFGLIWLHLGGANLRLIKKKSAPLELCLENLSIVNPAIQRGEADNNASLNLSFKADVLTVETEKEIYRENEPTAYEFSRLEYNRKTPEKGFVIKTEKRTKSAKDEQ
ncbi:MAG: hypothetical protein M3384_17035 [Acidobacteriota bacterium]|nr:hypothetical protein [Acidobacteriota bacterium]